MTGDYEHMEPVDGRPLTGLSREDSAMAAMACAIVARRTGTRAFYNVTNGKVLFCYGDEPFGGPLAVPLKTESGVRKYTAASAEAMADYINLGKMPRAEKDRIAEANDRRERQEREELGQKFRDGVRPEALAYAAFLDRRRRGVAKSIL